MAISRNPFISGLFQPLITLLVTEELPSPHERTAPYEFQIFASVLGNISTNLLTIVLCYR